MSNARTLASTINSSSQIVVPSGGVNFGTNTNGSGTVTGGVLDDYEEGTWNPSIATSTTQPTISYAFQPRGTYTKIGRFVYTTFFIQVSSVSSQGTGNVRLAGLPFSNDGTNSSVESPICTFFQAEPLGYTTINCLTGRGISTTQILISDLTNTGSGFSINTGSLTSGYLIGSFSYITSA